MYAQLIRSPAMPSRAVAARTPVRRPPQLLTPASAAPVRSAATPHGGPLDAMLARAVAARTTAPLSMPTLAPVTSPVVVARMPLPGAVRLPGPVLMRNGDGEEQQPEGWGSWLRRQASNPYVWAGVGLGLVVGGLAYYNRDSIKETLTGELLKQPKLLSTGAKIMGPDYIGDKVGDYIVSNLQEMAKGSSITGLTPGEHLSDVTDALVKLVPGGGVVNIGRKIGEQIAGNQQLVQTGLEVARDLGPQFVTQVVQKVAVEHGGDIALAGIEIGTKPMFESWSWALTHKGSMWG